MLLLLFAAIALGVYAHRLRSSAATSSTDEESEKPELAEKTQEQQAPQALSDEGVPEEQEPEEDVADFLRAEQEAPADLRAEVAAKEGDLKAVREATEPWIQEADTAEQRVDRRANAWMWESKAGNSQALSELRKLCDENPDSLAAVVALASSLRELGEPEQGAEELLERMASLDVADQALAAGRAASFLRDAGQAERSLEVALGGLSGDTLTSESEAALRMQAGLALHDLGRLVEALGQLERALTLDPSDTSGRWDLAYKYARAGYREPAILHYSALEEGGKSMTLNNLGAILSQFELNLIASHYYERAVDQGNARAAGNLAFKSIEAGLGNQAAAWIAKGLKADPSDERVTSASARLTKETRTEDDAAEEIRARGKEVRRVIEEFTRPSDGPPTGLWVFSTGETFDLTLQEDGSVEGSSQVEGSDERMTVEQADGSLVFIWRKGVLKSVQRRGVGVFHNDTVTGVYKDGAASHVFSATRPTNKPTESDTA